ncbi:MAG: hypothetical protein ACK455_11325 [Bacteroidota bacterium]
MKIKYIFLVVFSACFFSGFAQSKIEDSLMFRKLYAEAMLKGKSYENLEILCNTIGNRLTGSPQAERAVELTKKMFLDAKADSVFLQAVKVPHWVRGKKRNGKNYTSKTRPYVSCCRRKILSSKTYGIFCRNSCTWRFHCNSGARTKRKCC